MAYYRPMAISTARMSAIYHSGTAATRIDTSKRERWFCSVEEVLAAGWPAPRG